MKFINIPSGTYMMGAVDDEGFPEDKEKPRVKVHVDSFKISETTITNADFKKFVDETGYISEAEAAGYSFVFYKLIQDKNESDIDDVPGLPWWKSVKGANWKHPFGPDSTIKDIMDHPVVHVSRNDALAFCKWSNTRLPSEAEWEWAARGGVKDTVFPWGDELNQNNEYHANTWQGNFPAENTAADGYVGTAPVHTYEPNGYGLYQVIGNVWEWCSNRYNIPLEDFQKINSKDFWQKNNSYSEYDYATRGGSFLCHCSFCNRYRLGARNGNTANSTSSNLGFRVVKEN